jgi:hypothetical protein
MAAQPWRRQAAKGSWQQPVAAQLAAWQQRYRRHRMKQMKKTFSGAEEAEWKVVIGSRTVKKAEKNGETIIGEKR